MENLVLLGQDLQAQGTRQLFADFHPASVGLLVFDGEKTYALNQPAPADFRPHPQEPTLFVFSGRHPSIVANTITILDEHIFATLLLEPGCPLGREDLTALAVHEAFHAFQAARFPDWGANEATLFTYPFTDVEAETGKYLELVALARALQTNAKEALPWVKAHLEFRAARYGRLGAEVAAYERETERMEGLAQYVESQVRAIPLEPTPGFTPTEVRERGYLVGHILGKLLDRFVPDWQEVLLDRPEAYLDELLADACASTEAAGFTPGELAEAREKAERHICELLQARKQHLEVFRHLPGWRLTLTPKTPLYPQGFDPMNLHLLDEGRVLHTRYLVLANQELRLELLGVTALTEARGPHPLFGGVSAVRVHGLAEEPAKSEQEQELSVFAPGLRLRVSGDGASLEVSPSMLE